MLSLGIELSTQSAKTIVIDVDKSEVIYSDSFVYDKEFPAYNTSGGVLENMNSNIRHTSPFMLIEALYLIFKNLVKAGIDTSQFGAVKTDCMQHCTVYAGATFEKSVKELNPALDILTQLSSSITRESSPIWEDRSPIDEAGYLTKVLKSKGGITYLTGNRAEPRFPAPQIMKWAKEDPENYKKTSHIFLLSSFVSSILSGTIAPVDTGDGWGTNLNNCDIDNPSWSHDVLNIADKYIGEDSPASRIKEKIGRIVHYDTPIGKINNYFTFKYGVNKDAVILAGTGDNPATLLGCGGNITISLGSSYTVNGVMEKIIPSLDGEYNIFGYTEGKAMALSVVTNGAKVHDHFIRKYFLHSDDYEIKPDDWKRYVSMAGKAILSEDEKLMLPYLFNESLPLKKSGIVHNDIDINNPAEVIRSLHISQILSLKIHSSHLSDADNICIAGGASKNIFLRKLIADIFNAETYTIKNANYAAAMGCAISGARYIPGIDYDQAVKQFVQIDESSKLLPIKDNKYCINNLEKRYRDLENKRISRGQ